MSVKRKLYACFVSTYTTLPCIWNRWINEEINFFNNDEHEAEEIKNFIEYISNIQQAALSQFYDVNFLMNPFESDGNIFMELPENDRKFDKLVTNPYFKEDWIYVHVSHIPSGLFDADFVFSFPHHYLEFALERYEENGDSSISQKSLDMYKKNKELCMKIMAANDDDKEWFKLVLETEDEQFIIQNSEERIAKNPCNKNFWKLYIQYWQNKDPEIMLSLYSRYCRFQVDEMRQNYFKEILNLHQKSQLNVTNYWLDLVKIEQTFPPRYSCFASFKEVNNQYWKDIKESWEPYKSYWKNIEGLDADTASSLWIMNFFDSEYNLPTYLKFVKARHTENDMTAYFWDNYESEIILPNFDEFKLQTFSLCSSIIKHISKSPKVNQKLYKSCKYFYGHSRIAYCHMFHVFHIPDWILVDLGLLDKKPTHFAKCQMESLIIFPSTINKVVSEDGISFDWSLLNEFNKKPIDVQNFIFTNSLHIDNPLNRNCFSALFSNFSKLYIKYLKLISQSLTFKEILLLNNECNLISVRLIDVEILNDDDNFVTIEEVVETFPSITYLFIKSENIPFTENTAENLSKLIRKTKFVECVLDKIPDNFDINFFCKFLVDNMEPLCRISIGFQQDNDFTNAFKKNFLKFIKGWKISSASIIDFVTE